MCCLSYFFQWYLIKYLLLMQSYVLFFSRGFYNISEVDQKSLRMCESWQINNKNSHCVAISEESYTFHKFLVSDGFTWTYQYNSCTSEIYNYLKFAYLSTLVTKFYRTTLEEEHIFHLAQSRQSKTTFSTKMLVVLKAVMSAQAKNPLPLVHRHIFVWCLCL